MNLTWTRLVYYCLAAGFWLCPAVQAQNVHKTESMTDRVHQHGDVDRHAPRTMASA
jgi:hypothetical protein